MRQFAEKLEFISELGGVKKDAVFLVLSVAALTAGLLGVFPLPFDAAWVVIVLCGLPIVLRALAGLIKTFELRENVLVTLALMASVFVGEYAEAAEVALIMQIGELLEEVVLQRANAAAQDLKEAAGSGRGGHDADSAVLPERESKTPGTADRWVTWIVAAVIAVAALTGVIFRDLHRAASIFVVFCPCSFVLAKSTAVTAAIANAARHGFLVHDGEELQRLAASGAEEVYEGREGDSYLRALARRTDVTIRCNLVFSVSLNLLAILLAVLGKLPPVYGALVHNAGAILVILNSLLFLKWQA